MNCADMTGGHGRHEDRLEGPRSREGWEGLPRLLALRGLESPRLRAPLAESPGRIPSGINPRERNEIMLPASLRLHNHSPPPPSFLTDVDQWFTMRLPA